MINTGTTIVTFLMVFLIQNTQNRDSEAIQLKLDELIRAIEGAHLGLLDLEDRDEVQLKAERTKLFAESGVTETLEAHLKHGPHHTWPGHHATPPLCPPDHPAGSQSPRARPPPRRSRNHRQGLTRNPEPPVPPAAGGSAWRRGHGVGAAGGLSTRG